MSREQLRSFREAERRAERVAISAMSLLEIAALTSSRRLELETRTFLEDLQSDPLFHLMPLTFEIALEVAALGPSLKDPFDRVIVATARVHGLRLITSDQRIIDSRLVPTVE